MSFSIPGQCGSLAVVRHGSGVCLGPGIDAEGIRVNFIPEMFGFLADPAAELWLSIV